MVNRVISIANDFSRFPAGRYVTDGPFSGEAFRTKLLIPALASADSVEVDFEGARGYGSSFLDEAFAGLVRAGFDADDLLRRVSFLTKDASLKAEIRKYVLDEAKRQRDAGRG